MGKGAAKTVIGLLIVGVAVIVLVNVAKAPHR